jgi:hypothetical protein
MVLSQLEMLVAAMAEVGTTLMVRVVFDSDDDDEAGEGVGVERRELSLLRELSA